MPKRKKIVDTYTKTYKLRTAGDDGRTIEVSFPRTGFVVFLWKLFFLNFPPYQIPLPGIT